IFNVFLNEPSEFNYNYLINAIQEGKNKGIDFFDIRLIFIKLKTKIDFISKKSKFGNKYYNEYFGFCKTINSLINEKKYTKKIRDKYDILNYLDKLYLIVLKYTLYNHIEENYINSIQLSYIWNSSDMIFDKLKEKGLYKKGININDLENILLIEKKRVYVEYLTDKIETLKEEISIFGMNNFLSQIDCLEKNLNIYKINDDLYKNINILLNSFKFILILISYYNIFDEEGIDISKYNLDDEKLNEFKYLKNMFKNNFESFCQGFIDIKNIGKNSLDINDLLLKTQNGFIQSSSEKDIIDLINLSYEIIRIKSSLDNIKVN
ncbi:hypothetical protein, partial [Candidatus Vampirococcus lugosii]